MPLEAYMQKATASSMAKWRSCRTSQLSLLRGCSQNPGAIISKASLADAFAVALRHVSKSVQKIRTPSGDQPQKFAAQEFWDGSHTDPKIRLGVARHYSGGHA